MKNDRSAKCEKMSTLNVKSARSSKCEKPFSQLDDQSDGQLSLANLVGLVSFF